MKARQYLYGPSLAVSLYMGVGCSMAWAVTVDPAASEECRAATAATQTQLDALDRQWATGELSGYNRYSGTSMTASAVRKGIELEQQKLTDLTAKGDDAAAFAGSSSATAASIKDAIARFAALGDHVQADRQRNALNVWQQSIARISSGIRERIQQLQEVLADMERAYRDRRAPLESQLADAREQTCGEINQDVPDAPPDCEIEARYDRLRQQVADLTAAGERLRAYVERPLPEQYVPDIPSLCINGEDATITYHGFWRQISDRARQLNGFLSLASAGASVFGAGWSGPDPKSTTLTQHQSDSLQSLVITILDMGRDEILSMRDRTIPYEQGLEEYGKLREVQEQAEEAAETLRRHQICTVRHGVPAFYAGYRQIREEAKAITQDAARCGNQEQSLDAAALNRIYNWHHRGALRDQLGPDQDTGWTSRRGWLDQGFSGNGKPPVLYSVLCD